MWTMESEEKIRQTYPTALCELTQTTWINKTVWMETNVYDNIAMQCLPWKIIDNENYSVKQCGQDGTINMICVGYDVVIIIV